MHKLYKWLQKQKISIIRYRQQKQIIKIIYKIIKNNWDSVPSKPLLPWQAESIFEKVFNINSLCIRYTRLIRGDLITIYFGENEVGGWVDQTYQYFLLGLNDIELKFSYHDLQNAMNK